MQCLFYNRFLSEGDLETNQNEKMSKEELFKILYSKDYSKNGTQNDSEF